MSTFLVILSINRTSRTKKSLNADFGHQRIVAVAHKPVVKYSSVSFPEAASRMQERRRHLQKVCTTLKPKDKGYEGCYMPGENLYYVPSRNIVFCGIEKAGSTFWRRLLQIVGGGSTSESNPSLIEIGIAYLERGYVSLAKASVDEIQTIFRNSTSIVFVRDPYARLFSGWLDKLYNPNVYYWQTIGRTIKQYPSETSCGFDVHFPEFVDHISTLVLNGHCLDTHFSPNYQHCDPCMYDFDFVGFYETFKEDTMYIIDALNLTKEVTLNDFDRDAARDAINDAVDWVFYSKPYIHQCRVTFYCALFKVWNRLQSRGYIDSPFPYLTFGEAQNATAMDFKQKLLQSSLTMTAKRTKKIRHQAYQQAIGGLTKTQKAKVEKAFRKDFLLFKYRSGINSVSARYDMHGHEYFQDCPSMEN
ncbi:CHST9-like protein [Mya arenaria]|uniref:Carbohydrate sulfotransferase n=3 Tax=Mya arenaria TaxID=6604 RepID=A0ABY7FLU9_MYAAR|nr:carbohydrate sulfotransferase 9-like isoform X1 [Mya arenaria]WAR23165.1 CHST9-like protein [Mya arenaria]